MIERRRRLLLRALVVASFKVAGRHWNDLFGLTTECNPAGPADGEVSVPAPFAKWDAFNQ